MIQASSAFSQLGLPSNNFALSNEASVIKESLEQNVKEFEASEPQLYIEK